MNEEQISGSLNEERIPEWCAEVLVPKDDQGKRRLLLVRTAFDVIAETGFEGLRTRSVAERAGVNIATLHYYFPSKQDLVEGVAQFMSARFVTLHGPAPRPSGYGALDRLRQEFSDVEYYLACESKMLLVMQEFGMRGKRDAAVKQIVDQMYGHWREGFERMVQEGVATGVFRNDVEPEAMCSFLMSVFAGIAGMGGGGNMGEIARITEAWILSGKVKAEVERAAER
jgi:TetR/AcrR family transcriptional regulator, regulator of cefoperazone and chloramphenicol sensitivity